MPNTVLQKNRALLFVPNRGQTDEKARFIARVNGQQFYFMENGIAAVLYARAEGGETNDRDALLRDPLHKRAPASDTPMRGTALFLTFEGASTTQPVGQKDAAGRFHYFTGNDPSNWRTQIPGYEQLVYQSLYDGVDLTLTGSGGSLKFLWTLNTPSRIGAIRIRYEGAEEILIAEDGSLHIRHALGEMTDPAPVAWQEIGGERKPVSCAYVLEGDTVSFTISGAYDANAPLFIDPILPYSTYLGGSAYDQATELAVDSLGCVYAAGSTLSSNFPVTPGAFESTFAGTEMAFVTKFSPNGGSLVFSTFFGGDTGTTQCGGIALDSQLCLYLTGYTDSTSLPTKPGAFMTTYGGGAADAFAAKLSSDGAILVYSTYLGGNGEDNGYGIAVDAQGFAYITGRTSSSNFPVTPGAFQTTLRGSRNVFVTKLSPDGRSLSYSTYFGGSGNSWGSGVAVDAQGCAYITGSTQSANLPVTPGAFQTVSGGGNDAYVTKFAADGKSLVYSTYLGGSGYDGGSGIALDGYCAVVAGMTESPNFPVTPGTFQTVFGGGAFDAFVTKVAADGGSLIASTYLGGNNIDRGQAIALDLHGYTYVAGDTSSRNFPLTPLAVPSVCHGYSEVFISILSPGLDRLLVSYYLGGMYYDFAYGIALGADGAVYAAGYTNSPDFHTTPGAFQQKNAGDYDGYAVKAGFVLLKKASIALQGLQ